MLFFAFYLLKVILVSGLLYAYYLIALRNKKFHRYNRFYLLLTVLLSLIIPLVTIELQENSVPTVTKYFSLITNADVYVKQSATKETFISGFYLALYTFLVITSVVFFTVLYQLVRVLVIIKKSPKKAFKNICFVFPEDQKSPSSFFNYIFWNDNINIDSNEGDYILQHELTHVQQKHSLDKLFINIILIAAWANPFLWIIRKELNLLHEFIADEKAVSNGDTNAFAAMLLTAAYPQHTSILTNSFFHSPIKRRLRMFTTSKITRYSYFRRLMIFPLLLFISVLFAFKIAGSKEGAKPYVKGTKELSKEAQQKDDLTSVSDTLQKEARFMGGNEAWKKYLETNLNANVPLNDHAPKGIYTVKVKFIVTEEGAIKDVSALQVPAKCPSCGKEAVRIIKDGPRWDPAVADGRKVQSQNIQFISFLVE